MPLIPGAWRSAVIFVGREADGSYLQKGGLFCYLVFKRLRLKKGVCLKSGQKRLLGVTVSLLRLDRGLLLLRDICSSLFVINEASHRQWNRLWP